jgi:hypothetical protein
MLTDRGKKGGNRAFLLRQGFGGQAGLGIRLNYETRTPNPECRKKLQCQEKLNFIELKTSMDSRFHPPSLRLSAELQRIFDRNDSKKIKRQQKFCKGQE